MPCKIYGIFAVLCLSGCFTWGGSPWGGLGQPCYTSGGAPCDDDLVCDKETDLCRARTICDDTPSLCDPKPEPTPCSSSFDCGATQACTGGVCADYLASCVADADCRADYFCDGGQCTQQLKLAAPCQRATQCVSGACADGVCCESGCSGECRSCVASTNGVADGKCALFAVRTDPDHECVAGLGCDGAGACFKKNVGTCTSDAQCGTGHCADGVCCNEACDGPCETCDASGTCVKLKSMKDAGICDVTSNGGGTCARLPCACDALGDCKSAVGATCDANGTCGGTNFCRDGVCCSTTCNGTCEACETSMTRVASGTCAPIAAGLNSHHDCSGSNTCNGARACYPGTFGAACLNNNQCSSGYCVPSTLVTNCSGTCAYSYGMPGVCCENACLQTCMACAQSLTGQKSGACVASLGGTYCNWSGTCDASQNCRYPLGASCKAASECDDDTTCASDGHCKYPTGHKCSSGDQCADGACFCMTFIIDHKVCTCF